MICFYHESDLDGQCSAAIVKHKYPKVELIGVDYGKPFPFERVPARSRVIMVDFSLPFTEEGMLKLNDMCSLTWIDHHKSAIDVAHSIGFLASGGQVLEIGKAACELTWESLYPKEEVPRAVYLLGRYDVWDHYDKPDVMPFQYGLRALNYSVQDTEKWNNLFFPTPSTWLKEECTIISLGMMILDYQGGINRAVAKRCAFEGGFLTGTQYYRCICINSPYCNSALFDSVYDADKHHFMVSYYIDAQQQLSVSLYSTRADVDCSEVAKVFGGGGHKGAAGFVSADRSFLQTLLTM